MKNNVNNFDETNCDFLSIFFLFNSFIKYSQKIYCNLMKKEKCSSVSFDYAWIIVFTYTLKNATVSQLCELSNHNQSTISKAVNNLVKKELIQKNKVGKQVFLNLTAMGLEIYRKIQTTFVNEVRILNTKIHQKDLALLKKTLIKIVNDIKDNL